LLDDRGDPLDTPPRLASVRIGDCICLHSASADNETHLAGGLSTTNAGGEATRWLIVEEMCVVRRTLLLSSFPNICSAGDGKLKYRISVELDAHERSGEQSTTKSEVVSLCKLAGALVVRFGSRDSHGGKPDGQRFEMFELPAGVGDPMVLQKDLMSWAAADRASRVRQMKHQSDQVAREQLRRQFDDHQASFVLARKLLTSQGATKQQAGDHFEAIGRLLFKLYSAAADELAQSRGGVGSECEIKSDDVGSCATEAGQGMIPATKWRALWVDWVEQSDKWAEFTALGIRRADMELVVERHWGAMERKRHSRKSAWSANVDRSNSQRSKRQLRETNRVALHQLRELVNATRKSETPH